MSPNSFADLWQTNGLLSPDRFDVGRIKEILIITTPQDQDKFQSLLEIPMGY